MTTLSAIVATIGSMAILMGVSLLMYRWIRGAKGEQSD